MRTAERIDAMMDERNLTRILEGEGVSPWRELEILDAKKQIIEYWNKYPDMRLFQVLINMNLIDDCNRQWFIEDLDLIRKYNIDLSCDFTWTSYLDRDGNLLPEPMVKPICDLTSSHIDAIFKWANERGQHLGEWYHYILTSERNKRLHEKIDNLTEKAKKLCSDVENRLATKRLEMPRPAKPTELSSDRSSNSTHIEHCVMQEL